MMLWCLCLQKPKKNIISASGGKLESLQNHCLFLFPGFAEEDEKNKNTTILTYVVAAVRLDDYDIVIAV